MSGPNKARIIALTGGVAAITATGAWYGAGLKTRQEFKQEKQVIIQSSAADKIAQLQSTKEKLIKQRKELQNKINKLTAKPTPDATKTDGSDG
ncbi:uncharacterized protein RCC_01524 [Ramularia collo-cygni]|uniref:Uncharacterized protein n=1 Tax=Ramularia collo-cygni TaxID=112498 RepID=A0A2D3ULX6_9PEZI|nr:uncharacterized protein RCC_01524 [Ramularia collo-cygni]CZT15692.1 uncharacterized protein RCC_01524 [Ramularia collo-cygni]